MVTQNTEMKLYITFFVAIKRTMNENRIDIAIPWRAPESIASSVGITSQIEDVWNKDCISTGALSL